MPASFNGAPATPELPHRTRTAGKLTHFLAIPLHHAPGLQSSIDNFTSSIPPELGIAPSCVRPAACIHLTLGVMSLDDEKLKQAVQLLKDTDLQSVLQSTPPKTAGETKKDTIAPLQVTLKGLSSMSGPKKTRVLYMPPFDTTNRLQPFSEKLRDLFIDGGFIQKENRKLKLHGTVLNTIYGPKVKVSEEVQKKRVEEGKKRKRPESLEFDARELVERNKDRIWADGVEVERVVIYKMGAVDKNGVKGGRGYQAVAVKRFDGGFEEVSEEGVDEYEWI